MSAADQIRGPFLSQLGTTSPPTHLLSPFFDKSRSKKNLCWASVVALWWRSARTKQSQQQQLTQTSPTRRTARTYRQLMQFELAQLSFSLFLSRPRRLSIEGNIPAELILILPRMLATRAADWARKWARAQPRRPSHARPFFSLSSSLPLCLPCMLAGQVKQTESTQAAFQ